MCISVSDFDSGPAAINTGPDSHHEEVSCFSPFILHPLNFFFQLDIRFSLVKLSHVFH